MPLIGPKALDKIVQTVRARRLTELTPGDLGLPYGIAVFEGETISKIYATTDGRLTPSTGYAREYVPIPNETNDPPRFQLGERIFKLVNRSSRLPAVEIGTYCIWIRIKNEFRMIFVDC